MEDITKLYEANTSVPRIQKTYHLQVSARTLTGLIEAYQHARRGNKLAELSLFPEWLSRSDLEVEQPAGWTYIGNWPEGFWIDKAAPLQDSIYAIANALSE